MFTAYEIFLSDNFFSDDYTVSFHGNTVCFHCIGKDTVEHCVAIYVNEDDDNYFWELDDERVEGVYPDDMREIAKEVDSLFAQVC